MAPDLAPRLSVTVMGIKSPAAARLVRSASGVWRIISPASYSLLYSGFPPSTISKIPFTTSGSSLARSMVMPTTVGTVCSGISGAVKLPMMPW